VVIGVGAGEDMGRRWVWWDDLMGELEEWRM
jgi:hypothetical protein